MKMIPLCVGLVAQVAGWVYVVELLKRTRMGELETSIGNDVVVIVYLVAAVGVAAPLWLLRAGKNPRRAWGVLLLLTGVALLVCFAWLHLSGKVGHYVKEF